jgi:hypothetical protein
MNECRTDAHVEIARVMMDRFPECVTATYNEPEYFGENVLHIAIVKQRFDWVKELLSRSRELLQARATGRFFSRSVAGTFFDLQHICNTFCIHRHICTLACNSVADSGNGVFGWCVCKQRPAVLLW